ncbi:MAG: response regulator [Bacteroidota bacterium]|nr:response regulator [Ferruginibacter sp.]
MNRHFIMVAEDDADDRYLMQTALDETGFKEDVSFVDNGVELIHHLEALDEQDGASGFPRLIMLDLNMPKMDGREVLKKIKSHDNFKRIPVVVFSTTKNQLEVQRCYDLGANTYIVKPASYDRLVETIREVCTYWFKTATLIDHH